MEATHHKIGHLPFEVDLTTLLKFGEENRLTVMVSNVLGENTIPQGQVLDTFG